MFDRGWLTGAGWAAAFLVAAPYAVSAQEMAHGSIAVSNPIIAASVERLATQSESWREAVDAVAATGRRAIVTTSDKVRGAEPAALAQVQPIAGEGSRVDLVLSSSISSCFNASAQLSRQGG